jgi:4-hydroxybenzoate polyprenyltransferase
VDNWIPEAARPYAMLARLDKPIGTWLLAWPCMWYLTFSLGFPCCSLRWLLIQHV